MGKKILPIIFICILIAALLAFYFEGTISPQQASRPQADPVYADFRSSISELGESIPVTAAMVQSADHVKYQIFNKFITAFDANRPAGQQVYLVPIGRMFKLDQLPADKYVPVAPDAGGSIRVVDGIQIWGELNAIMDKYGYIIGKPLTGLLYNREQGTYEQYFENMAFARKLSDPVGQVYLLNYGEWWYAVDEKRQTPGQGTNAVPGGEMPPVIISPFQANIVVQTWSERLNRAEAGFTGLQLHKALERPDGSYEVVFEKMVFSVNPSTSRVNLLNLPVLLGYRQETLDPRLLDPNNIFFVVDEQNQLGYNVVTRFVEYVTLHSDLAGRPIQSTSDIGGGNLMQCFENYCLVMHEDQILAKQPVISLLSLGQDYLEEVLNLQSAEPTAAPTATPVVVEPAAEMLLLFPDYEAPNLLTGKKPSMLATAMKNDQPFAGLNLYTVVNLPNASLTFHMPPTDGSGKTRVNLEGLESAAGNFLNFQVCVDTGTQLDYCTPGSFYYQP